MWEADRHAKKELKKLVRGVCPLERAAEQRPGPTGEVALGYCAAMRSALTDDARVPLVFDGLRLHEQLSSIHASARRAAQKKGGTEVKRLSDMLGRALDRTAGLWPQVAQGASWLHGASAILSNDEALPADALMARYQDWIAYQAGAQQALRGHRRAAATRIQRLEVIIHVDQDGVDQHPQFAQWMRIRDAFLQRAVAVQRVLGDVGLAYDCFGEVGLMQQRLPARDG
ncbi:hypothetical protein CD932_19240 [Janthinobacterium sp. PC23-8]|nr:hypothetical protein CD932_19240 [Janthinobacterium sp. PC23-8]